MVKKAVFFVAFPSVIFCSKSSGIAGKNGITGKKNLRLSLTKQLLIDEFLYPLLYDRMFFISICLI